jgi:hypothetical protein
MPRLPGEIRASPILCLQVGHDGRSAIEVLITQTSGAPTIGVIRSSGLHTRPLSDKILAQLLGYPGTTLKNLN